MAVSSILIAQRRNLKSSSFITLICRKTLRVLICVTFSCSCHAAVYAVEGIAVMFSCRTANYLSMTK